ncbi:hypothetical protein CCC_02199 [Paramagnetospirillum magnetotacticum MS-1]|uniref:Uncharacterized protein n=1 Tax=Paramagnetospirillum magnetotacticum MS-1 TaxID=272627 RepID=A0A0C2YG66_PARME|nr:hypothetical protein CCC_02199 [Paramagnetospirillum magnetotacticum MS-1]
MLVCVGHVGQVLCFATLPWGAFAPPSEGENAVTRQFLQRCIAETQMQFCRMALLLKNRAIGGDAHPFANFAISGVFRKSAEFCEGGEKLFRQSHHEKRGR